MLISLRITVISVLSLSCLASAFSTLFVTEEAGEGRKTEEAGTKTPKTEESNVAENKVIVETIPFFTDVFTKVEDVMNLTPLKVATIISGQHLIDTVKAIPVSGNSPQNEIDMLSNIVDEFNKTTQIIKLTAEYVNISSHYMLSSLNKFSKFNPKDESVKATMKEINKHFMGVISSHVKAAVEEITKKSEHREMTGTDVLVSSAYHIVAAFQEMTNHVMSIKTENNKFDNPKTPQNSEQITVIEKTETEYDQTNKKFEDFKHDASHKSIKKDQALPYSQLTFTSGGKLQDTLTIENMDQNPDLTLEIYPHSSVIFDKKGEKPLVTESVMIPESLKVAFLPDTKTTYKNEELTKKENKLQLQLGNTKNKDLTFHVQNIGDILTLGNVNPKDELTMEIFSPQNKKQESPPYEDIGKTRKESDSFNVYYFPLKSSAQNKNPLTIGNSKNYLRVPEDLKMHYYPTSLQAQNAEMLQNKFEKDTSPFKTFTLFGNYDNEKTRQKEQYDATRFEGLKVYPNKDDIPIEKLNNQDLTVEVFSPEEFIQNGKIESSEETKKVIKELFGIKETKSNPKLEFKFNDLKNDNPKKNQDPKRFNHKNPKIKGLDKELSSSNIDSLSNIPTISYEAREKNLRNRKTKKNSRIDSSTLLMPWEKRPSKNQKTVHRNQQKHNLCDEKVEPVCGVDKNRNNFIIFPNDCQRKQHNSVYRTSYQGEDMNKCIGFLLKYSAGKPTKITP